MIARSVGAVLATGVFCVVQAGGQMCRVSFEPSGCAPAAVSGTTAELAPPPCSAAWHVSERGTGVVAPGDMQGSAVSVKLDAARQTPLFASTYERISFDLDDMFIAGIHGATEVNGVLHVFVEGELSGSISCDPATPQGLVCGEFSSAVQIRIFVDGALQADGYVQIARLESGPVFESFGGLEGKLEGSPDLASVAATASFPLEGLPVGSTFSLKIEALLWAFASGNYTDNDAAVNFRTAFVPGRVVLALPMGFTGVSLHGSIVNGKYAPPWLTRGDLNCDRQANFDDIDGFIVALLGPDAYAEHLPGCNRDLADMNCDGRVDFDDIDGFIVCLIGNCACPGGG